MGDVKTMLRCFRCGIWRPEEDAIFMDVTAFGDTERRFICGGCAFHRTWHPLDFDGVTATSDPTTATDLHSSDGGQADG